MKVEHKNIIRLKLAGELKSAQRKLEISEGELNSAMTRLEERRKERDTAKVEVEALVAALDLIAPAQE